MSNIIKAIQAIYPEVKDQDGAIIDGGIKGGFTYWESKQNGSPLDNPIDGLIWENTEFSKPTWNQIEAKLSNIQLQEAQDSKIAQISIKRETISEKSIVTHNSKDYANSQNARVAILRRIASLNDVETKVYFTYPDQEVVNLNKADFEAIAVLIEDKELLARQKEGDFISQVKVCLTVDEVNDINIDFS